MLATERVSGRRAEPLHGNVPRLIVVVERKPHLESDLVMRHRAVFDMAARLHYLEPADLTERARSAADSVLDRVLDALLRGTGDLDNPVNVIGHRHPSVAWWFVLLLNAGRLGSSRSTAFKGPACASSLETVSSSRESGSLQISPTSLACRDVSSPASTSASAGLSAGGLVRLHPPSGPAASVVEAEA